MHKFEIVLFVAEYNDRDTICRWWGRVIETPLTEAGCIVALNRLGRDEPPEYIRYEAWRDGERFTPLSPRQKAERDAAIAERERERELNLIPF